jgi:hypothetical protein
MSQRKKPADSPKRKMSEMISEMAAGFLGVGDTIEERQNRPKFDCDNLSSTGRIPAIQPCHFTRRS